MMKKSVLVMLLVVFLAFASSSLAQELPEYICSSDLDCLEVSQIIGQDYPYCNLATGTCFSLESEVQIETLTTEENVTVEENVSNATADTTTPSQALLESLQLQIIELEDTLDNVKTRLSSLETQNLQQQLNGLDTQLQQLKFKLQEIETVKSELSSVAVGLAGLQQELNQTTSEVNSIEETLEKKAARNKVIVIFIVILLVIGAALGTGYYLMRKKRPFGKVNQKIVDYITNHIQKGQKFPQIKAKLLQAGWSEEEINWAYKETAKKNYQKFKEQKEPARLTAEKKEGAGPDKRKIITIAVVSVLLIVGVFLILSGTVGKAIYFQKLVGGEIGGTAGEVTYEVECTPPHTLNPAKDGCCLDVNNNAVCDYIEEQEAAAEKVALGERCTDNFQCPSGELCINGGCSSLDQLYKGSPLCDKMCQYYALNILTSDQETYNIKPNQGSYTAAGALEWKTMQTPAHCNGEKAIIPIKIIKKEASGILSEEVITLKQGQTSEVLDHPKLPKVAFTLKLEEVYEVCS